MEKVVVNNYGSFDVTFVKAKGSTMWDINKKKYIDFIAGIGVNCLGHNYKPLVKAIAKQAKKQIHISNYFFSDVGICYSLDLLEQTGFDRAYFGNSGAEANEAAIKLARKYGQLNGGDKRKTIVTLESSFHGRTLATLTATGQDKFHPDCFAPYPDGFKTIKANDYESLKGAFDANGLGAVINSSRAVMCAYKKEGCDEREFAKAARREVLRMRDDINSVINK